MQTKKSGKRRKKEDKTVGKKLKLKDRLCSKRMIQASSKQAGT